MPPSGPCRAIGVGSACLRQVARHCLLLARVGKRWQPMAPGCPLGNRAVRVQGARPGAVMPPCSGAYQRHLKMFTAREMTSTTTMSEVASSAIIISFIHGLIADTSGGLNDVAVEKEKWKQ